MTPAALAVLATILALPFVAAQDRPNFSGTWTMDPSRSASAVQNEPIVSVTQVIVQTPNELRVETQRPDGVLAVTYRLDGSETKIADGTARLHWEGTTLVTEAVRIIKDQTVTTKETRRLNHDGSEMLVETTLVVQHGYTLRATPNYGVGRDVYTRVQPR
jgi:hypothetical protein